MAKVQSRRCVSLNRNVYEDLKRYSRASGVPMSAFIEDLIRAAMARPGESAPAKVLQFVPRRSSSEAVPAAAPRRSEPGASVRYAGGVHEF